MDSKNIVVTNHRLQKDLTDVYEAITGVSSSDIKTAVEDTVKIFIGKILKWYPGINRCQCRVDGKNVECNILHSMFNNDTYTSYTPNGDIKLSDDKSSYFIEPSDELYGALLEVKTTGTARYVLIGFLDYNLNNINITPGNPGELKIKVGGTCIVIARNHIRVDCNQLIINGSPYTETKEEIEELNFNENYYNKEEVNALIEKLKKENDLK